MQTYDDPEIVNIGVGTDVTICDLAQLLREVVGFEGRLSFDATKPDGTPRKLVDVTKLTQLGWTATTELRAGVVGTYTWFKQALTTATVRL